MRIKDFSFENLSFIFTCVKEPSAIELKCSRILPIRRHRPERDGSLALTQEDIKSYENLKKFHIKNILLYLLYLHIIFVSRDIIRKTLRLVACTESSKGSVYLLTVQLSVELLTKRPLPIDWLPDCREQDPTRDYCLLVRRKLSLTNSLGIIWRRNGF